MQINLDLTSEVPIYMQIRNEIILGLAVGQLKYGQNLPSVRQLALDLDVNHMTVNKAYQTLKAEGVIETNRQTGTRIVTQRVGDVSTDYVDRLKILLAEGLVQSGDYQGFMEELNKIVELFKKGAD